MPWGKKNLKFSPKIDLVVLIQMHKNKTNFLAKAREITFCRSLSYSA